MPEIPDAAGTVVPVPAGAPGGGFSYLDPVADLVPGGDGQPRGRGFRIHDSTSRGRRFAFAAAGAFSMAAIAIGSTLPMEAAMDGGARPDDGPAVIPVTAGQVSDTRGTTPRGVLESERQERRQSPSVGASATSVALAGSLLAGGVVPLSAAPTAAPAAVALAAGQQAAETASAARQADTAAASSGSSALPR
ncbi:hypothetical protein [Actinacidiphila yeochonensis]|uniref:hypothetical protein n=1 Tax=Actinacidiphila yeochonensis TaxID=89050 RepID=UPI0006904827|nr:hypothetical protein [Actinacidiphila yeochonensis]